MKALDSTPIFWLEKARTDNLKVASTAPLPLTLATLREGKSLNTPSLHWDEDLKLEFGQGSDHTLLLVVVNTAKEPLYLAEEPLVKNGGTFCLPSVPSAINGKGKLLESLGTNYNWTESDGNDWSKVWIPGAPIDMYGPGSSSVGVFTFSHSGYTGPGDLFRGVGAVVKFTRYGGCYIGGETNVDSIFTSNPNGCAIKTHSKISQDKFYNDCIHNKGQSTGSSGAIKCAMFSATNDFGVVTAVLS